MADNLDSPLPSIELRVTLYMDDVSECESSDSKSEKTLSVFEPNSESNADSESKNEVQTEMQTNISDHSFEANDPSHTLATLISFMFGYSMTQTINLAIYNALENQLDYIEPYTLLILTLAISIGSCKQIWQPKDSSVLQVFILLKVAGLILTGILLAHQHRNTDASRTFDCVPDFFLSEPGRQSVYKCRTFMDVFTYMVTVLVGDLFILVLLVGVLFLSTAGA